MGAKGIVFGAKDIPMKGIVKDVEPISAGKIDVIGHCAPGYLRMLRDSAEDYNLRFPKYIHWVITNPRGEAYGYYLVREKRL